MTDKKGPLKSMTESRLKKNLIHRARQFDAGEPVPNDLTEDQKKRLKRLGVL